MRTTLRVGQLMGSSSLPVQGPAHIPFKQVTLACTLKVQGRTEPWTWLPAAREHRGDCSRGSTASNQLALTCHDFYAKLVTSQNAACCRCCFLIIGCMTYTGHLTGHTMLRLLVILIRQYPCDLPTYLGNFEISSDERHRSLNECMKKYVT